MKSRRRMKSEINPSRRRLETREGVHSQQQVLRPPAGEHESVRHEGPAGGAGVLLPFDTAIVQDCRMQGRAAGGSGRIRCRGDAGERGT